MIRLIIALACSMAINIYCAIFMVKYEQTIDKQNKVIKLQSQTIEDYEIAIDRYKQIVKYNICWRIPSIPNQKVGQP